MTQDTKTAFISYSWDNKDHEQWVMDLVIELRNNGVDASFDKYETQNKTTNLYQMMIKNMRDNNNVIVVLTENYAKKADNMQGGVGFETLLSLPDVQQNPDKFIFLLRHKGRFEAVFPFHLRGFYAIDFSDDHQFNDKFLELLHRIEGKPFYEKVPLGPKRELTPRRTIGSTIERKEVIFDGIELPNYKNVTDLDKERFLSDSYDEIQRLFVELFNQIKKGNSNFEFTSEQISQKKHVFKLYLDGQQKTGVKMWLGGQFGRGINLSYGNHIDPFSDSSMNESIHCDVTDKKELVLKMTLNIFGNKEASDPKGIVQEIWKSSLAHYIK